jgi:tRNA (cmo5U34)-methyltransferase
LVLELKGYAEIRSDHMTSSPGGPLQYASGDAVARFERAADASLPGRESVMRMAAAILAAQAPAGGSVLSVGAGTGLELSILLHTRPDWSVSGVDPSASMVELARARLAAETMADRLSLVTGTVDHLPSDVTFDGAICLMVLGILPNDAARRALMENVAQRLRPGAPFVFTLACGDPHSEDFESPWRWYQRGMGQNADEIEALVRQVRAPDFYWPTEQAITNLLTASGFMQPRRFFQAFWFGGWVTGKG